MDTIERHPQSETAGCPNPMDVYHWLIEQLFEAELTYTSGMMPVAEVIALTGATTTIIEK